MKKIAILLTATILSVSLIKAQTPVEKLFEKYDGKDDITSVYITKYMFNLISKIETEEEDDDFQEITSKLDGIRILVSEGGVNLYDEIAPQLGDEYKELMIVKEKGELVKMLVNEQDDVIKEFLILVKEDYDNESVVLVISGDIDLKTISKLSKSIDIKGMEHLDKVDDEKND